MKLSCCSLRRISRTRKLVFTIKPAISTAKKITPRNSMTPSRQFRMIQPTLSATASPTRHTPSVTKKAIVLRREVMRMGVRTDSTALPVWRRHGCPGASVRRARTLLHPCCRWRSFVSLKREVPSRRREIVRGLRLADALFPEIRTGLLELGDEVDTLLRVQIDDFDALLSKPVHPPLRIHRVAHNHL